MAFPLALMLLMVLLLAVIDAGVNIGNRSEVAHAAREGALFDPMTAAPNHSECALYGDVPNSARDLLCFTKERTHMDASRVRVMITGDGHRRTVCVMAQAYSPTGMFAFVTDGRAFTARSVVTTRHAGTEVAETPLRSTNWNFCTRGV